jgi:hypothetical protein
MKKKRLVLLSALCVLFAMLTGIVAFAGDYDTPTIPICSNHRYVLSEATEPTCTERGSYKYICSKCYKTNYEYPPALGHQYNLGEYQTVDGVQLKCHDCGAEEIFDAEYLESMWMNSSGSFINNAPLRTADYSVSAYFDMDANNIVNGKDFGIIMKLVNNQNKLKAAQNQPQNENQIIEFDLNNWDEFDLTP